MATPTTQTASERTAEGLTLAAQAGLLAGSFLSTVDANLVNAAIPDLARQLRSPLATAPWVVSGCLPALAAVLAASALLARRFGTRWVYLAGLLGFTVASGLCALAPSIQVQITLRALQGAAGAPLVPLAMNRLLGGGGSCRRMPPSAGMIPFLAPAPGPPPGGLRRHRPAGRAGLARDRGSLPPARPTSGRLAHQRTS
jgi:MFS family permease